MVDLRLYRAAFVPAVLAVVALLFSLQSLPAALRPLISPSTFDRATAARFAHEVVARAPDRAPGSDGDSVAADLVEKQFRSVTGGEVLNQTFTSDGTSMRNVVLRLPGTGERVVALVAPRDSAGGPGATTSGAATGALMELATELGATRHQATILLASTDGATAGAAGAKELASGLLADAQVDGVVILDGAGVPEPRPPYLIDTSDGPNRGGVQLERTAERALHDQAGVAVKRPAALAQLGRLAIPSGLGEQAPLIDRGIDAVTISAAGERALPAAEQDLASLSSTTLGNFGRAAFDTVLSLDSAAGGLESGPESYIEVSGNLVPGWAVAVLALALILPALVAAVDALARAARQGEAAAALLWAALRAVPLLAGLALLYVLALIGIVARPDFAFDPATIGVGFSEVVVMILLAGVVAGVWQLLGRNSVPQALSQQAAASALGGLAVLAVLALWLVNPFLALLAVPFAHAWVPAARQGGAGRAIVIFTLVVVAVPVGLAVASVASRLHLGASMPWQALVMVGDGGTPLVVAVAGAALTGWLAALAIPAPGSRGWTDSLSRPPGTTPMLSMEHGSRPGGDDQDDGITPGRETERVEAADRHGRVPGGRQRSGGRDSQEAESDQEGSPGDGDALS